MNILLSAYNCEPSRGSEASVGWNWAYELVRAGQSVWVVTSPWGKAGIEKFFATTPMPRLTVVYVDMPYFPARFVVGKFSVLLHSLLWQRHALTVARRLTSKVEFHVVHHVSWASLHVGSQLWRLGKPFVFGPVGGGQTAPRGFGRYLRGERTMEFMRSVFIRHLTAYFLSAKSTVAHADLVLAANSDTRALVERLGVARVEEMVDCGIPKELIRSMPKRRSDLNVLKILWVGRLLPRKGVLLALEALAQLDRTLQFTCTIVGDGQQGSYVPGCIERLGLATRVVWRRQLPWSEVLAAYPNHDVFLFTSLRDTSGTQLAEAMASGNAIVALDHHGPKMFVPQNAGIKVPVTGPRETAGELARAIERLANEPETLSTMGRDALEAAASLTWARKIERAIELYRLICKTKAGSAEEINALSE